MKSKNSKVTVTGPDTQLPMTCSPHQARLVLEGFAALAWRTAEVQQISPLLSKLEAIAARARPQLPPAPPPAAEG